MLLDQICKSLGVGSVFVHQESNMAHFVVTDKKVLSEVIIPFIEEHPVYGLHSIFFFNGTKLSSTA
uniref:Homing endonuclease LAGLIDADG domain-containing protein n=1 Tax=Phlebia radiata TaxID=5308 RepID=L8B986_PHLRA|nr:hypothetical protein PRA_mt0069 [Phlebia radiata]YP_007374973.1 hypothetical protein PRA_mt0189 [Phlebia radiata]CCE89188.1 hypothetical protein PRA_mt0069 [Phlebia radiata]CCE89251.1 hypothetical protein PRA_mt0189 [Phlebia radiata]